jgi:hypothetical protein
MQTMPTASYLAFAGELFCRIHICGSPQKIYQPLTPSMFDGRVRVRVRDRGRDRVRV